MRQGDFLLCLFRDCEFRWEGPALSATDDSDAPIIWARLPDFPGQHIVFPKVTHTSTVSQGVCAAAPSPALQYAISSGMGSARSLTTAASRRSLSLLDDNTRQQLQDYIERDVLCHLSKVELDIIWEKRFYVRERWVNGDRNALTRVLQAADSWSWHHLGEIYGLLDDWGSAVPEIHPIDALQLLSPEFPDVEVHRFAVDAIKRSMLKRPEDALTNYLPQLVCALRSENYDDSPLARFLLESAMKEIAVAHDLFWLVPIPAIIYNDRYIISPCLPIGC